MASPFRSPVARSWQSDRAAEFIAEESALLASLDRDGLDARLHALVDAQERRLDRDCLSFYAGTNIANPRLGRLLGSSIGSRPNLGAPGDTYNPAMDDASRISVLTEGLIGSLFAAAYAETRVASGSIANLYAYFATTRPGDQIIAFSDEAAGHVTHHRAGAAGYAGLTTHSAPWSADTMDVDVEGLARLADQVHPTLIIVAGSMCLFPYSVAAVREIADGVGAKVLYDAAHMGGMIAGGRFQSPLAEGADILTGSTYKSLGGPPSGMILTNDPELAERVEAIAFPGLTANFDLAKTAAMALAALDMHTYGPAYADACIANAQALAAGLAAEGVDVFDVPARAGHPDLNGSAPFTVSQHVAVRAAGYGGGNRAARELEQAGIVLSSIGLPVERAVAVDGDANGIRLGTQELTRWGMGTHEMAVAAGLLARGLRAVAGGQTADLAGLRSDVRSFRSGFQTVRFVRS